MSVTKGHLGLYPKQNSVADLTFIFNPSTVKRGRKAMYAPNNAARADLPAGKGLPAVEWLRNSAEETQFELLFDATADIDRESDDVEAELQQLDNFMKPVGARGEPSDLILVLGVRSDLVRLVDKSVEEILHSADLRVQRARVTVNFVLLQSRRSGGG